MNGEIGVGDVKHQSLDVENFRNILPEKEMTAKELNDAVTEEFYKAAMEARMENSEQKEYFDDHGNKFREGDRLLPNHKFEVNGYQYETDSKGRVVSAGGRLRLRDPNYKREMEKVRQLDGQEYRQTDDRGHLIAHQFDASDHLENLVPMDAKLNRGDYAKLENTLADAVKDGADVRLQVEPIYEGDSTRPSEFRITYSIDGDKDVVVFRNGGEAKA